MAKLKPVKKSDDGDAATSGALAGASGAALVVFGHPTGAPRHRDAGAVQGSRCGGDGLLIEQVEEAKLDETRDVQREARRGARSDKGVKTRSLVVKR